jgi:hypothetical protein
MTNTITNPPKINRELGSEYTSPTLLIATSPHGHETIYLGHLNSDAILRVFAGGYRVLAKDRHGSWATGRALDDSSAIAFAGSLAAVVENLTGRPPTKAGAELLSLLPQKAGVAHGAIVRRDEARMDTLKYVPADLQPLRESMAFRGL